MLDDAVSIRRIGELQAKNLSVFLGLLEPVALIRVNRLCLYNCNWKVAPVAEKVVQTFLWMPFHFAARDDDAAICKTFLFAYLIVGPSGGIELWQDVEAAGIGFSKKSHSSLVSVWTAMIADGSNSLVCRVRHFSLL